MNMRVSHVVEKSGRRMPTIVAVRPDERKSDHYHIEFDNGAELLLDEAIVADERLAPGDTLDDADLERLRAAEEERTLIDRAAMFLAVRPRSRTETRRRLLRPAPHRTPPTAAAVDRALDRLEHMGYLDDAAFAEYWTEQRERFSPRSARAIQQELRQRGIDAETAAASAHPEGDEERAVTAGRKRLASLISADFQTFTNRMGGFLQRRGFSYGVSRTAIHRLWEELHGDPPHADELDGLEEE